MKRAAWFIVSELLMLLTIVLVFSNWHGNVGFNLGWPLNACSVTINGNAQGARILLAFLTALLTITTFLVALIRLFARAKADASGPKRPSATSAPPPSTTPS